MTKPAKGLPVSAPRLDSDVALTMDQTRVLLRVSIHGIQPVEHGVSIRQWLPAECAQATLLFALQRLQCLPVGRSAALVIGEFFVDLTAQGKQKFSVVAGQFTEALPDIVNKRPRVFQLGFGEFPVGHSYS